MWYGMDGNTISIEEGAALLQDDRRQIALTVLGEGDDEVRISTVFLVIDHGLGNVPILWETMVFGGPLDMEQERYASREAALEGHQAMTARVLAALNAEGNDKP